MPFCLPFRVSPTKLSSFTRITQLSTFTGPQYRLFTIHRSGSVQSRISQPRPSYPKCIPGTLGCTPVYSAGKTVTSLPSVPAHEEEAFDYVQGYVSGTQLIVLAWLAMVMIITPLSEEKNGEEGNKLAEFTKTRRSPATETLRPDKSQDITGEREWAKDGILCLEGIAKEELRIVTLASPMEEHQIAFHNSGSTMSEIVYQLADRYSRNLDPVVPQTLLVIVLVSKHYARRCKHITRLDLASIWALSYVLVSAVRRQFAVPETLADLRNTLNRASLGRESFGLKPDCFGLGGLDLEEMLDLRNSRIEASEGRLPEQQSVTEELVREQKFWEHETGEAPSPLAIFCGCLALFLFVGILDTL